MMNRTTRLRKILRCILLSSISDDRLYEGFNNGDKLPKVNYKLESIQNDDSCDRWTLEINIWSSDSLLADQYADQIEDALNYVSLCKDGCSITIYPIVRRNVEDPEPKIERRLMTYSIENYNMEVIE